MAAKKANPKCEACESKDAWLREKNPAWKGDNISDRTGRQRARAWFASPEGKERHHIDGNPLNNDPSNIEFVTRRDHMVEDGRLERLHPTGGEPT